MVCFSGCEMANSLVEEEIQRLVREKLNSEKVKLWLPPYTQEDGSKGEQPQVSFNMSCVLGFLSFFSFLFVLQ